MPKHLNLRIKKFMRHPVRVLDVFSLFFIICKPVINEYSDIQIFSNEYIRIRKCLAIFIPTNKFGYSFGKFLQRRIYSFYSFNHKKIFDYLIFLRISRIHLTNQKTICIHFRQATAGLTWLRLNWGWHILFKLSILLLQTDSPLFPLFQLQTWRRPGLSKGPESKFIVTNESPSSGQVITRLIHLDLAQNYPSQRVHYH
jgi:hypothetical protein